MIDTSALVAALVADHEHHAMARAHLSAAGSIPAIVLSETFSQLRRTFGQSADAAATMLAPWTKDPGRILPTTVSAVTTIFTRARELDLGGSIHDALIAQVCIEHGLVLTTLDARQHRLALALGGGSAYLLA